MSDKIKAHHLNRNAVLYVRQSSTFQVTHNEESRRLQYAMEQRIRNLGWQEVSVIDEDLGRSASGNVERPQYAWVKWEWSQRERSPALPATVRIGNS